MNTYLIVLSLLGVALSLYALQVEHASRVDKNHKAACDLRENISCTRAFTSEYGKLFKIPNALLGIFFYLIVFTLTLIAQFQIIFYLATLALAGSIYLAYLSYIKMKNFCLVCTAIYIINVLMFLVLI